MATAPQENPKPAPASGGGLSLQTLVIASAGSVAAAVFTHMIWKGGAIVGAAITPIIVALVSESLKKPAQVITAVAPVVRRNGTAGSGAYGGDDQATVPRTGSGAPMAPPPEAEDEPYEPYEPTVSPQQSAAPRDDRFGIWEADKRSFWDRVKGRPLKIALATGALAFVIGALALTATELVFGGSVGGGDRITIIPGKQKKSDDKPATQTTTTETTETTETAPAEEETATTPAETTPTVPTVPPTQTAPQTVPTTPQPTPAPQSAPEPVTPQGTQTAPGGTEAPPAG